MEGETNNIELFSRERKAHGTLEEDKGVRISLGFFNPGSIQVVFQYGVAVVALTKANI